MNTVIDATDPNGEPAILVGHSLGGAVISQTAERVPSRIDRLIYVAAFMLENGGSVLKTMESDEDGQFLPQLVFSEDESHASVREPTWREIAFHDATEEAIQLALPRLAERQSTQPFVTPLDLTQARFGSVAKTFLRTTEDRVVSPNLQTRMIDNWPVDRVINLAAGHFPTLSMPGELARWILEADHPAPTPSTSRAESIV